MMRRLAMCAIAAAALLAADGARAQAPLQITPPAARPPASIPGKPAKKWLPSLLSKAEFIRLTPRLSEIAPSNLTHLEYAQIQRRL